MDCDRLAESEELTLDLRPKGAKHAGAFFSRAQGLIIGAGTFASVTNIVHNMPVFTDMFPSELFEGPLCDLLAEQRLYGTVGRWDCIRRISAVKVDHRKSLMAPTTYEKEVSKMQWSAKSSSLRFEPKKHTAEKVVHLQYYSLVSISDVCACNAQDSDVINFRSLVGVHLMLPGQRKVDCTSGIQHSTSHSSRFYDPPPNRAPSSHNLDINRGIIKLVRLLRQGMGWPRGWGHVPGLPTQDLTVVPVSLLPVAPPASRSSLLSSFNRARTTEASKFESSAIHFSRILLFYDGSGFSAIATIRPLEHPIHAWMAGTLG
ncbi:hypothetical protein MVEN_01182800 [Mycena venus]|uniref:Uncharacterized protein n=1 Tax=Mycena venus TaxID=2733690 RepID=A0A8H7CVT9_9AGAR|nr:hypothetical protein MVEN_01182800 [Mycena venus]